MLSRAHRDIGTLLPRIDFVAEEAGSLANPSLEHALTVLLNAIAVRLLPHFEREDEVLIAVLGAPEGALAAGDLLRLQHAQIRQVVSRLAAGRLALQREPAHRQLEVLRARLYGLHALLVAHREQEQEVVRPFLTAAIGATTALEEA
jgi:Hemerythrin HHE cation binding domain